MRAGYQWSHHVIRGLELPVPPLLTPTTLPLCTESERGMRLSSVAKGNGVTNHTYVIMGSESSGLVNT